MNKHHLGSHILQPGCGKMVSFISGGVTGVAFKHFLFQTSPLQFGGTFSILTPTFPLWWLKKNPTNLVLVHPDERVRVLQSTKLHGDG